MKKVRIGNYEYRAKQIGWYPAHYDGTSKAKCEYQFRPILFGFIPLPWDSYYGTFTKEYIENDLKGKQNGPILNLDI